MNVPAHTHCDLASTQRLAQDTPLSLAFTAMMPTLARYIEAERDLGDVCGSYDPAYALWHRDAERAEANLRHALQACRATQVMLTEDRPLRRTATLIAMMLDEHEPSHARQLHREMRAAFFKQFQVPGFGVVAQHRNGLLIQARHLIDALNRLPLFDFDPDYAVNQIDEPDADDQMTAAF